jgi:pimeloyl-ACP methyl ester carboxylesterase
MSLKNLVTPIDEFLCADRSTVIGIHEGGRTKARRKIRRKESLSEAFFYVAGEPGGTAWKSKPNWYIVAKNDHTVPPDLERFFAKRMGATTTEAASSHVVMLAQPKVVIDVILKAAKTVQGAKATA